MVRENCGACKRREPIPTGYLNWQMSTFALPPDLKAGIRAELARCGKPWVPCACEEAEPECSCDLCRKGYPPDRLRQSIREDGHDLLMLVEQLDRLASNPDVAPLALRLLQNRMRRACCLLAAAGDDLDNACRATRRVNFTKDMSCSR